MPRSHLVNLAGITVLLPLGLALGQQTLPRQLSLKDAAPVELHRVRSGRLQYRKAMLKAWKAYQQVLRDILNKWFWAEAKCSA